MAGRVSFGGRDVDIQDAISVLEEQLTAARVAAALPIAEQLNATIRDQAEQASVRPNFDLVNSIEVFEGEKPDTIDRFFTSLEDVGELSNWTHVERLKVAKLRITGAALKFVQSEDQARLSTYDDFKRALTERFGDKAPRHCYLQQLSVIQQRRGETIEAFADRVRTLNEKTIRITANAEVNKALREEADRRALDAFVRGLMGSVGEQTRLKFPTDMREAITTAVAVEFLLKPTGLAAPERKVFQTDVTCYKCHRKGHISRDCRSSQSDDRSPSTNQTKSWGPARTVLCWRCRRPGHVQKDCRVKIQGNPGNEVGVSVLADTKPRQ